MRGYGCNTSLRSGVSALGLSYVAGILPNTSVWVNGTGPLPPKPWSGRGRRSKLIRRDDKHQPLSVKQLALDLPKKAWRTITWREGSYERLSSRFARVRVCPAHRDYQLTASRPEEWLLIEWPEGEKEPTKYWLSTLPKKITFRSLVDLTKLRYGTHFHILAATCGTTSKSHIVRRRGQILPVVQPKQITAHPLALESRERARESHGAI
jgi:SRSO17 transposase